jgi:hypothetical protein
MLWGEEKSHFPAKNQTMIPLSFLPIAQSLTPISYPSSLSSHPTRSTALLAQPTAAQ